MRDFSRVAVAGLVSIVAGLVATARPVAADPKCARCGSGDCQKICRLVREEKTVTITCWGIKDEDFCVPSPSKPGCKNTDWVCDTPQSDDVCAHPKRFVWTEWIPGNCPKIFTKHKLMKKTVTKKIPSYKWVVEDLCSQCEEELEVATLEPGAEIPPAPAVAAQRR